MAKRKNRSGIDRQRKTKETDVEERGDGGCTMSIKLKSKGTINIYNCPPEQTGGSDQTPTHEEECLQPPKATGACIPVALGSKHKDGMQFKLDALIQNSTGPSVLAATMIQQIRRYLSDESPGSRLEESVFKVLDQAAQESPDFIPCVMENFDNLDRQQRDSLFTPEILAVDDRPLPPELISNLFAQELEAWAADEVFEDERCQDERPGLPRPIFSTVNGGAFLGFIPRICRVNGLRTIHFLPHLGLGDYNPEEFEQICTTEIVNEEPKLNCQVQTEDCPGNRIGTADNGGCLVVPNVSTGETVILEGVNFFNTNATVRLQAKPPGSQSAEIPAFVCGDVDTPATEEINGVDVAINDCRVEDRLTFQIPDELAVGIYEVRVVVPNNTGVEGTDPEYVSDEVYIRVLPPDTAVFQIASETIHAKEETSPGWIGSDEVGLRMLAVPVFSDLTLGPLDQPFDFRINNVDSGDTRDISRVLIQESGLAGVSIAIFGYEIDSEEAFEKEIDSRLEVFVKIMKAIWDELKELLTAAVAAIWKKYAIKGLIAVGIAAIVVLAVVVVIALWAPADLIIEDAIGYSSLDLASLTNANFPLPPETEYTSTGGIKVKIIPESKGVQYEERREYRSGDSEYHLKFRYNRIS